MPNIVIDLTEPSSHRADLIDLTNAASDGSEAGDYPLKRPSSQQVTPRTVLRRIPVMQQQHQPQQQQLLHNSPKGPVQLPLSSNFAPRSNLVHMSPSATTKHAADKLPIDQVKTASPAQTRTPPQQSTDPVAPLASTTHINSPTGRQPEGVGSASMKSRASALHPATLQPRSSPAGPMAAQLTPKGVTPRRSEWTVEKIAEKLRHLTEDLNYQHRMMTYRALQTSRQQIKEWRQLEGEDLFAGLKAESVPEEKGLTVRAKFKLHTSSNRKSNSSAGKRNLNLPVVALKTEAEAVPPYRFHHIEIPKSVLTPQTMLKYVPHVRDLDDSEERQYNLWLQELDEMDAASGFKPQSREQRAANTKRDETAARLATMLPSWLKTLSIEGCTKANLIRYMASEAHDDTITPQQKTSLIDSCRKVDDIGSPRSIRAVKQFTEAFDLVFSRERSEYPVTLRDVLFRDDFVDQIVDPKRLTKEVIAPSKPTETLEPADGYLETHSLLACLICFCNSCDHGEYDNKNQKRTFSMEVMGGVEGALKRRPLRLTRDRATQEEKVLYSQPCGDECFQLIDGEIPPGVMTPWTTRELRILRALVETSPVGPSFRLPECTISGFLQRPCWEVHLKMKQAKLSPKVAPATTPPKPVKNLAWYDRHRKMLVGDWQEHTRVYEHQRRELLEPCTHDGSCTSACPCVQAGVLCERFCRCTAEICAYKFTGCACHSLGKTCFSKQKERPCICVQLNRECDPALCKGCGAVERVDPANLGDDDLHQTGCQNCALQRGQTKRLMLGKSLLDGCGYGLFTAEDIAQDEFVIEYVGELITHDEGVRREARRGDVFNEGSNASYLFTLLEDEGIWVDAAVYGNLSRYINHASESDKRACNIMPKILYVNGEYRIRFSAMRDIRAGEELFFNYGENFPNLTKKLLEDRADQVDEPSTAAEGSSKGPAQKAGRRRSGRPDREGRRGDTRRKPAKQTGARPLGKKVVNATAADWELPETTEPVQQRHPHLKKRKRVVEDDGEEEGGAEAAEEEEEEREEEGDEEEEKSDGGDESGEGSDWEAGGRRGTRGAARSRKRARRTDTEVQEEEAILEAMGSPSRPPRRTGAAAASSRTRKSNTAARSVEVGEAADAAGDEGHVSDSDSAPLAHRRASRQDHRVATDSGVDGGGQGETVVHRTALRPSEEDNLETNTADERGREDEDGDEDEDGTPSRGKSTRKVQVPARYREEEEEEA